VKYRKKGLMKILRLQTGKRAESDTDSKNARKGMINVTIVEFAQIAGYGTYCEKLG